MNSRYNRIGTMGVVAVFILLSSGPADLQGGESTHQIRVSPGWNLLSLPAGVDDGSAATLFPNAVSAPYVFDASSGYHRRDTLVDGVGFWLRFASFDTIQIQGEAKLSNTMPVRTGWNTIGSLALPILASTVETNPPGIIASPFFRYVADGGYEEVDTLLPGVGYWVKSSQNGAILTSWEGVALNDSTAEPEALPNFITVTVDSTQIVLTYATAGDLPLFFPGQILAGNSGGGYARRVVSSVPGGNQLVVQTERAAYDEVVDFAHVDTTCEIEFPDDSTLQRLLGRPLQVERFTAHGSYMITGSAPIIIRSPNARLLTLSYPNIQIQVSSGSGQASISVDTLTFALEATVQTFDLVFNFGLETFRFITELRPTVTFYNAKMTLTGQLLDRTDSLQLVEIPLGVIPTAVPGLFITPEFNLMLGLQSTIAVSGTALVKDTVQMGLVLQTGFEYVEGSLNPVWETDAIGDVQSDVDFSGTITATQNLFLKPSIDFRVNGTIGLGIFAKPYLYDQFTYPPFGAEIGGGVAGGISASMQLFSRTLFNYELQLADFRWKWYSAHGPLVPSSPNPHHDTTGMGTAPILSWTCSDPDGDPVTYDVYFGTEFPPTTLVSDDQDSTTFAVDTLEQATVYNWKVVARDSNNNVTEGPAWRFSTGLIPLAPLLLSPPNGASGQPTSLTLNWDSSAGATSYTIQVSTDAAFGSFVSNQTGLVGISMQLTGLANDTTYFWRVAAGNSAGASGWSEVWSFATGTLCPATVTYGGQVYNTVFIGGQCWLRENLNIGTFTPDTILTSETVGIEKYCFNNNPSYCGTYGGLYMWNEAMNYSVSEGARGICPSGWHIPRKSEMEALMAYVGGSYNGEALLAIGQGAGTNTSGFSALLAGFAANMGSFGGGLYVGLGTVGVFHASTEFDAAWAYFLHLGDNGDVAVSFNEKIHARNVRCIKN